LFVTIGFSIFMTVVAVAAVMHLTSNNNTSWKTEAEHFQSAVNGEFVRVWDTPQERDALASRLAHALDYQVQLDDAQGRVLTQIGPTCQHWMFETPVVRDGVKLGTLRGCADRYRSPPWRWLIPLGVVTLMLWMLAGRLSRRILRPLDMVVQVAEALGSGKLSARADMSCYHYGEERVLAESINRMADRIERQMADQRELLAAVSHELRTPLGHLRLLIEMTRDGALPRYFDEMEQEVTEIDSLVADLLANSRLNFSALSTRALDGGELAARSLERAGLPASLLSVDGSASFSGDATLISRALANLLDNAKGHGGGAQRLKVSADGNMVRFEVEDSGPGFAPGDERRAFEPFYHRPHGASGENGRSGAEAGSLGLGLALVKRIAEAHGGKVEAGNRAEGGARVAFTVAVKPPAERTNEGASART
jgi:signal transduction histidine kinase